MTLPSGSNDPSGLPPEHLELAAAAPLGGREGRLRLGVRHSRVGEHLGGHRRGQPQTDHHPGELTPAEGALLDLPNPLPKLTLVHGGAS
jgi:hypothetical protein